MIVWKDVRGPLRDFIRQVFFLALTGLLQLAKRALDLTGTPTWLLGMIGTVFDALTVVALACLAVNILLGMVRSAFKVTKS